MCKVSNMLRCRGWHIKLTSHRDKENNRDETDVLVVSLGVNPSRVILFKRNDHPLHNMETGTKHLGGSFSRGIQVMLPSRRATNAWPRRRRCSRGSMSSLYRVIHPHQQGVYAYISTIRKLGRWSRASKQMIEQRDKCIDKNKGRLLHFWFPCEALFVFYIRETHSYNLCMPILICVIELACSTLSFLVWWHVCMYKLIILNHCSKQAKNLSTLWNTLDIKLKNNVSRRIHRYYIKFQLSFSW